MPQYDAYEDPLTSTTTSHELGEGHDGIQTAPTHAPSTTTSQTPHGQSGHPVLEPGVPVMSDGIYKIHPSNNDPFHSAMSSHTHERHSSLVHEDPGAHLVQTTLTHPASADPSPKTLNAAEQASLAAYTKAQADDDSIRLVLACERCGEDLNHKNQTNDPNEFAKEAHMLNGGWMHRSQARCELSRPKGAL